MKPSLRLRKHGRLWLPALMLIVLTGCSSDSEPEARPRGPRGDHAKASAPMAGQDTFFEGQILAEIKVGTDGIPEVATDENGGHGGGGSGGRGGGGRLSFSGGNGGMSGNISGSRPFGGGGRSRRGGSGDSDNDTGAAPAPRAAMMGRGRPVVIHLRFTNRGTAPVTLVIDDFASALGDFAVRPEQLALAPGQSRETDPMTSQLAGSLAEVDATLTLRAGARGEKKTFPLRAVKPLPGGPAGQTAAQPPNPPKS